MGFTVAKKKRQNRKETEDIHSGYDDWVRNPSWISMPTVTASEQKVVGIFAVFPESNFLGLSFTLSSGSFSVNWGDGVTESIASAGQGFHQYNYTDPDLDGTDAPVTFTASTSTVNRTAHGYTNRMRVRFYNIVTTTGLYEDNDYFVINATSNTFQVSTTENGSAVTLTNNGSATLLPYKQALVTITPVTSGATFSVVNLNLKHSQSLLQNFMTLNWLELNVSAPNAVTFVLGSGTLTSIPFLEKANIVSLASLGSGSQEMFKNCYALRSVSLGNTSNWQAWNSLFSQCNSLKTVPRLDMTGAQSSTSMFQNCHSLEYIPPIIGNANNTTMNQMFNGCSSLKIAPFMNMSAGTNCNSMFLNCYSLIDVPRYNTPNMTNCNSFFSNCYSLVKPPKFDTSKVTNFASMFSTCYALQEIPDYSYALGQDFSSMFSTCWSLKSIPDMNMPNATTCSSMFNGCRSLVNAPKITTGTALTNTSQMFLACFSLTSLQWFNTQNVTNMSNMFQNCYALKTIPTFTTSACTTFGNMFSSSGITIVPALNGNAVTSSAGYNTLFNGASSISQIKMTNLKWTFSVASQKLSPAALDALYTLLPTVTGQTITVSNNWGTASDTPSIATAKGWTVTG